MKSLKARLKEYRQENELSQKAMAERVGISFRTYQSIEGSGEAKKVEDMRKINAIIGGNDEKNGANGKKIKEVPSYEERLIRIEAHLKVYGNALASILVNSDPLKLSGKLGDLNAAVEEEVNKILSGQQ